MAKTIVFCVDQEHADEMRSVISNLSADLVKDNPDCVCRVTADEGDVGRGHLSRFQDIEATTPVVLTTSQLLTTGVDAPMVKNIALVRMVGSVWEFKQIIGRGTRVRDDYGKYFFTILDYTGSATRHFADPEFDGDPALVDDQHIDGQGQVTEEEIIQPEPDHGPRDTEEQEDSVEQGETVIHEPLETVQPRKYYVDGGAVEIAHEFVYELDASGRRLRVIRYTDYAGEQVRNLYPSAVDLRRLWQIADQRNEIIERLAERGIDFDELAEAAQQPHADRFDLLCHVAYNAPLRTRRERADRLRHDKKDFVEQYGPEARMILGELLEKYAEHGLAQFKIPEVLKVPPISDRGNVVEISRFFGGADNLRQAIKEPQALLYAA